MEEKKYFRVLTLLSSIFMILLGVAMMFGTAILAVAFLGVFTGSDTGTIVFIVAGGWLIQIFIVFFGLTLSILTITMGAKEIKFIKMQPKEYKRAFGKIIGHLIFDGIMFAICAFLIMFFAQAGGNVDFLAYFFACFALMFFICFWFVLIDQIIFSSKVKKGKISSEELNPTQAPSNVNFAAANQTPVNKENGINQLEKDLLKLKELHEKGLLNDEEFAVQKQSILEKNTNK